ncbi:hypothetical protein MSPP1_003905 [Malassezia sp. CBS 17886]|nr:hypothetical protein MSPP1_003905 [Malassezia sp. CBS 17886]
MSSRLALATLGAPAFTRYPAALLARRWSSTEAATTGPATHYRVTLRRSAIGLPRRTGRVLEALGLRRRLQSVYHEQNAAIAGAILAVKELVHVDNVRRLDQVSVEADADTIWVNAEGEVVDAGRRSRKAPRGFRIVGNLVDEERNAAHQQ